MQQLTRIEQLDQRFPGLADKVKAWFDQGVHVRKVVELLRAEYGIHVPKSTVGNFRARRWVGDRQARQTELVASRALSAVCRELEMKDCPQAPTACLQAKVRALLNPNIRGCFKRAAQNQARD